jgi:hypothetical protein
MVTKIADRAELAAMRFPALDIILWLTEIVLDVRGHIPRFEDFRPVPAAPAVGPSHAMRVLAAIVAVFAALSLAVWAAVWLAIQLL